MCVETLGYVGLQNCLSERLSGKRSHINPPLPAFNQILRTSEDSEDIIMRIKENNLVSVK